MTKQKTKKPSLAKRLKSLEKGQSMTVYFSTYQYTSIRTELARQKLSGLNFTSKLSENRDGVVITRE